MKVELEFDNFLLTDTYVIKVFVVDEKNNVSIQNNSYIFKVQPFGFKMCGYVTLNQSIEYKVVN